MFKNTSLGVAALALLLAVQVGIIALLYGPQVLGRSADDEASAVAPLLPALNPSTIERLSLHGDDHILSLARDGSDGWVLPNAGNFPVLAANVTQLISDVIALDTSRLVATTPESHVRLGVDAANPIRRVDIGLSSGLTETVFIGSSPNARATHVRRAGSDDVYLARDLDTADLRMDAGGWVDPTFLTLDPSTVQEVTLENANGSLALQRDAAGSWSLAGLADGEQVLSATVDSWLNALATLTMLRPLGREPEPAWGLADPQATVTLTLTDGEAVELLLGARDPADDSVAATLSTSPWIVALTGAQVDPLLMADRPSLVLAAPTPVPLPPTTPVTATVTTSATTPVTP